MKCKWFLGAFACLILCSLVFAFWNSDTHVAISGSDSDILSSDTYYIKYSSKFLLANSEPVVIEEAVKDNFSAERYILDGKTLLMVEDGKHAKVYYDNELIEELEINLSSPSVVARYKNLKYKNRTGSVTIEDTQLIYEEYDCISDGTVKSIRFLYNQKNLWGLQFAAGGQYVQILELSRTIPENLTTYFSA